MAIGEYAGILTFGIIGTGALAYNPSYLELFIIGGVVFSILFAKVTNWAYFKINRSKVNFLIFGLIAGIIASIGIFISSNHGIILKLNGSIWLVMAIGLMKSNLDEVLK